MNVSKEDDAAFMRELEQTDKTRFSNLQRNMRLSVRRDRASTAGTLEFASKMQSWKRAATKRAKKTGTLPTGWKVCAHCKEPFEPVRQTTATCSARTACPRRTPAPTSPP